MPREGRWEALPSERWISLCLSSSCWGGSKAGDPGLWEVQKLLTVVTVSPCSKNQGNKPLLSMLSTPIPGEGALG